MEGTQTNLDTGKIRKVKRELKSDAPSQFNVTAITQNQVMEVAGYDFAAHQKEMNKIKVNSSFENADYRPL